MPVKERLILAGGGGFSREVAAWARHAAEAGSSPPVAGFLDDKPSDPSLYPAPYLGPITDYKAEAHDRMVIAVGSPKAKEAIASTLRDLGARFAQLIHPTAILGGKNLLGEGVIMAPMSMNTVNTRMGDFVTLLSFSGLGHDSSAGHYATISSHVDLMGGAAIGDRVFVGSGARIMPGVQVGADAVIGAGSMVLRRVKEGTTVYAAPARRL